MADAIFDQVSAEIEAAAPGQEKPYLLRASASHMRFPGFRQLYIEGRDTDAPDDDAEKTLPDLHGRRRAAATSACSPTSTSPNRRRASRKRRS